MSTHKPFNYILQLLDAECNEEAVMEAAIAVGFYIPESAQYAVDPKGVDLEALSKSLWRLYFSSKPHKSLVKDLGSVVWEGNTLFN